MLNNFYHLIKKAFPILCLLITLWVPSTARAQADITITFGSYCCGTDTALETEIMEYIQFSKDIRSWKKNDNAIGKEGEHSLDINLTKDADLAMVYDDLRKMIPRYSDKAPTAIEGKGLAKFETGMMPPEKKK